MRYIWFTSLLYCILTSTNSSAEDSCRDRKVAILNVPLLPVNMGNFDCPAKCDIFCKKIKEKPIIPFSYPKGLTKGDRTMIAKYPKESLIAYQLKEKTDSLTKKIFKNPKRNSESDAFRHFVWAALMTKELGPAKANEFLNAHEEEDGQPAKEKEMDIANNKSGTDFATSKHKEGKTIELNIIEKEGLERLKNGKLKVINPSKEKIPDGYYSN